MIGFRFVYTEYDKLLAIVKIICDEPEKSRNKAKDAKFLQQYVTVNAIKRLPDIKVQNVYLITAIKSSRYVTVTVSRLESIDRFGLKPCCLLQRCVYVCE